MSGMDGHGISTLGDVRAYLSSIGEEWLLKYIRETGGRFGLVEPEYNQIKLPSVKYQLACIFMILGEYTIADEIYQLRWSDLSSWGDKVGNGLLKNFMLSYPWTP